jgi:hypothetical protein
MTIVKKTIVTLLFLIGFPVVSSVLVSPAAAQNTAATGPAGQLLVTTSTMVGLGPASTFESGHVHVPTCPRGTRFLVTAVQAAPAFFGDDVLDLPKWAISVHVSQLASNGSSSPHLTAFSDGPAQAATSIGGGQPLSLNQDSNFSIRLLGGTPTVSTTFAVHVTGYCGVALVTP